MSGSAAGSKRSNAASASSAAPAAPAAAVPASSSRMTTRLQARAMAGQSQTQSEAAAALVASSAASAAAPAAAAVASAPAAASTASAAASSSVLSAESAPFAPKRAPLRRRADPPSLFCAKSPDPLSLILSFVLIELPVALGQSCFPKELVRIIHEYASDACFSVELVKNDDKGLTHTYSNSRSSTKKLLTWIGRNLPCAPSSLAVRDLWGDADDVLLAHCDSCLMDEELKVDYHPDISRLLHAQLKPNEYRSCYLEIEPGERGRQRDPTDYFNSVDLSEHDQFCLHALHNRKAKIVACGQKPVAVSLSELLERLRTTLKSGELPRGLSPRPCDWSPLFGWIRGFEEKLNELRESNWEYAVYEYEWDQGPVDHAPEAPLGPCPRESVLSAVLVRSTTEGAPVAIQGEAYLWSHEPVRRLLHKPAASMMIDEDDEDDDLAVQPRHPAAQFAAASSSAAASSAAAAAAGFSLSADEEAKARGAPRQRRKSSHRLLLNSSRSRRSLHMSSSAPAAAAASNSSSSAAAAAPSASSAQEEPLAYVQPPAMLSASALDPLCLILSFALIDVPILTGRPYFPKELVRMIHGYASDPSFVVELAGSSAGSGKCTALDSTSHFMSWLGRRLPLALDAWSAMQAQDEGWNGETLSEFMMRDSCMMDEQLRARYGSDISRLLHAQLLNDEYRACYLDIPPHEDGTPITPNEYWIKHAPLGWHDRYCLADLDKRKAAIVARGKTPVSVGMHELLERVRFAFEEDELPCGLSPRPCDWTPLFAWVRALEDEVNDIRHELWAEDHSPGDVCPFQPPLHAIKVQLRYAEFSGTPIEVHTQACLWSWKKETRMLMQPAPSMMIEANDAEEQEQMQSDTLHAGAAGASATSSTAPAAAAGSSSSVAAVSPSLSAASHSSAAGADEEAAARGAPRQRRE